MTNHQSSPTLPDDAASDAEHWLHYAEWTQQASDPAFRLVQGVAVVVVVLLAAAWACMVPPFG